jgi:hypothetical protein
VQPERKIRSDMPHADDARRLPPRPVALVLLTVALAATGCASKWAGAPTTQETVEGRLVTVQYVKADAGYDVRATMSPFYAPDSTYDPNRLEAGADRAMGKICGSVRPNKENAVSGYMAYIARYRC